MNLGITQVDLSAQAEVALPTLQALESGASNPSLETLEKLGRVLGLSVELHRRKCDWDRLAELGLPIMASQASRPKARASGTSSKDQLVLELRCAIAEVFVDKAQVDDLDRKRDAISGLLLALAEHYPSVFKKCFAKNPQALALAQIRSGKVIKLRRLATARIAEYL